MSAGCLSAGCPESVTTRWPSECGDECDRASVTEKEKEDQMSTQTIEPWLREILRCPVTKSELVDGVGPDGTPELQAVEADAAGVRRAYRIEGGTLKTVGLLTI